MDLLKRVEHTVKSVEHSATGAVSGAAKTVTGAANTVAKTGFGKDVMNVARGTVSDVGFAADRLGLAVVHAPAAAGTWARLFNAARTGKRTLLPGQMPAYSTLTPDQLAQGKAAGAGQTVKQGYLADKDGTGASEPVTLMITASRADLVKTLQRQGWVENSGRSLGNYARQFMAVLTHYKRVTDGPVSEQYLNGKLEDMAFTKNCDYNLSRDHMRIYQAGTDPASGLPVWAIAASRDEAATVTLHKPTFGSLNPRDWHLQPPSFGHQTDPQVDKERDLIMHDLLASGNVASWATVKGDEQGKEWKRQSNGSYKSGNYVTDGNVYQLSLGQPASQG